MSPATPRRFALVVRLFVRPRRLLPPGRGNPEPLKHQISWVHPRPDHHILRCGSRARNYTSVSRQRASNSSRFSEVPCSGRQPAADDAARVGLAAGRRRRPARSALVRSRDQTLSTVEAVAVTTAGPPSRSRSASACQTISRWVSRPSRPGRGSPGTRAWCATRPARARLDRRAAPRRDDGGSGSGALDGPCTHHGQRCLWVARG